MRHRWQDGWVKKEVRPGGGERRTKGNGGAARSAAVSKPRRKPPRTSPTGSIASATLQNPAESRLRRAQREASPRRPCKSPWKAASDEPFGEHRLGDRARHPVAGGGVQKKRCSAGRAADRAKRERAAPPPGQAAKKAALSLPSGGTNGCRKSGVRLAKKEVRPGGGGEKEKRERRRCAQRRRWKIPWKAASDEPLGKHRRGGIGKTRGGRPPQTSPTGSIVSVALQKPVEARLRRALRRASPRRPWKSPRCSRPQRGCSRGRSPPRRRRWRRGC